jgi:hypothetical protein
MVWLEKLVFYILSNLQKIPFCNKKGNYLAVSRFNVESTCVKKKARIVVIGWLGLLELRDRSS